MLWISQDTAPHSCCRRVSFQRSSRRSQASSPQTRVRLRTFTLYRQRLFVVLFGFYTRRYHLPREHNRKMFSAVFDKVVSEKAPGALAVFPPRVALPVPSSTLCCLSFADRFLSPYLDGGNEIRSNNSSGDDLGNRISSTSIPVSEDDLVLTMQTAAELGGRLAAALAGTERTRQRQTRDPATATVSDLLTKVRGIFGNRLACIGREIRVSRDDRAERNETILLHQIHALKNAALKHCEGDKWCAIVSSGGESIAVCSVPLPPAPETASGCDFLVFDPWPRPAMKLHGSYVVKFTTVRCVPPQQARSLLTDHRYNARAWILCSCSVVQTRSVTECPKIFSPVLYLFRGVG